MRVSFIFADGSEESFEWIYDDNAYISGTGTELLSGRNYEVVEFENVETVSMEWGSSKEWSGFNYNEWSIPNEGEVDCVIMLPFGLEYDILMGSFSNWRTTEYGDQVSVYPEELMLGELGNPFILNVLLKGAPKTFYD